MSERGNVALCIGSVIAEGTASDQEALLECRG